MADLEVVAIPNGAFVQNCYLVGNPATGDAVVVDPGEEVTRFAAELEIRAWRATAIWLTHAHIDHILGVAAVHEETGAPILLHPADRQLYDGLPRQAEAFGLRAQTPPPPEAGLHHGQVLNALGTAFEVRHAPGHSPGSVCFVHPGFVLSGDVLFAGSIGRTDLPGGDTETLLASIRRELFTLPDDTRVLSGHGPETTIGEERRTNPFLR